MEVYYKELIPYSSKDWPEADCIVIKLAGNNFRCPYSSDPELLEMSKEFLVEKREIEEEISDCSNRIKNVLFSGGEPTLQQEALIELSRFCKSKGFKVGIVTNGSKYFALKKLIDHALVDYIRLDIMAPLFDDNLFDRATRSRTFFASSLDIIADIKKSINLLKDVRVSDNLPIEIEVQTTIVPGLVYRKEDLMKIGDDIRKLKCTWTLNQFYRGEEEILVDEKYHSIKFPSMEFLENLKKTMQLEFPELTIKTRQNTH